LLLSAIPVSESIDAMYALLQLTISHI
jgi:hypothetical protein